MLTSAERRPRRRQINRNTSLKRWGVPRRFGIECAGLGVCVATWDTGCVALANGGTGIIEPAMWLEGEVVVPLEC